ncbi:MAG: HAMP domain-containing protein [Alphaproteobacteria bacterium]|nr:HAMP domain-containing protein [Alphaproteobacteria bacterium]
MSLRVRVFTAMAALLALTVLGAWALAGGAVLRPLLGAVADERVDVAVYVANEIMAEPDQPERERRARELSRELGLRLRLVPDAPPHLEREGVRSFERDGRVVMFFPRGRHGEHRGTLVSLGPNGTAPWLSLHFRADTDSPQRNVGLGLVMLGGGAVLIAVLISRWMLRPLELSAQAMARVADGDLAHRVEPGGAGDAAAGIGHTFNRMADRVEGMVRGQQDLMAAVSHELRTPLTRLRLQAELLREAGAPEARVAAMEQDIGEMDELVGELLESARLHQGLLALHLGEVGLAELVASCVQAAELGERVVSVDVPPDLVLVADGARLRRVLKNLLSNVRRYTPADARVEIRATLSRDGDAGQVVLVVADDGPGVPDDALGRLFDPFFRAEGSRSRATGGLGLGLMLVQQIVLAHGGAVDAMNRPAGGLMVRIRLPVEQ